MKKIIIALLLAFPLLSKAQTSEGIRFMQAHTWAEVLKAAQASGKYIFVDAYTTWCGPCKAMEQQVYPLADVGSFFNKNFISVKLQMDTTAKDDTRTRSLRADAKKFGEDNKVEAFPSYLFFDPQGKLVHREMGAVPGKKLISFGQQALDPKMHSDQRIADFKSGKVKDIAQLVDLEKLAKTMKRDGLKDSIAIVIKTQCIDKMNEQELLTKPVIDFLLGHAKLVRSKDLVFKIARRFPEKIDNLARKGMGEWLVNAVVTKEEVSEHIWKDGNIVNQTPAWNQYKAAIKRKYPELQADNMIYERQEMYHLLRGDWLAAAKVRNEILKANPPATPNDAFWNLNSPAWKVFLFSSDPKALQIALGWSNWSIKMSPEMKDNIQFLDTRANLLYKLGRVEEAIQQEEVAVRNSEILSNGKGPDKEYVQILEKMKKGERTWPDQQ